MTSRLFAEPPPQRETLVPTPGRSIAGNDQSSTISLNPANLAFMPSSEIRWTWVRTGQESPQPGRGHAFDFALAAPFGIGTGLRLDFVRPQAAAFPFSQPYTWLTWGLGIRANDGLSFGLSVQHAYSQDGFMDGPTSLTAAITARPSPYFGLSLVGRDLNSPQTRFWGEVDRSVDVGIVIRPTGHRDFEIGLEERYLDASGHWIPRATIGIDVPHIGRAYGEISTSDLTRLNIKQPDRLGYGAFVYTATAGVEIGLGTASVEGGAVWGTGLGGEGGAGFYSGAAIGMRRSPGIPERRYALKIQIDETPPPRAHVALLRRLWRIAADPEIAAVVLSLKAEPTDSLAHAEELGDAIRMLRANGKKVVCQMEDAKARALYVCSQADRIAMQPAGVVRFSGLKTQYQYYASLLGKLGVRAQFVRIGAHKSAPEAFTRDGSTEVTRRDHIDLLREYEEVFLHDIGGGRQISTRDLAATFAKGPFVGKEAKDARLVDTFAFDDELEKVVEETTGCPIRLRDEARPQWIPSRFGLRPGVAIVYVDGDMVDGKSRDIPLVGSRLAGSRTIAKALKEARENPMIAAVVLRIESPGGSSLAADVMWREAVLTARAKPLIVSMGTSAASGGYYVASAGRTIFANPLSVTGSIGIFYGKADISELLAKIGVSIETYKTSPRADGESIYRPYSPEELAELEIKVRQLYEVFLDRVAQGRKMTRAEVDAVGQGRVWTGRQAHARHLVDRLGGIREALAEAIRAGGLPSDAPITELPVPEPSLLSLALKLAGAEEPSREVTSAILPTQVIDLARALVPWTVYEPDEPLARLELVPLGQP
jgi:protease IV